MITELRIQNFKSWRDTGTMRFAPLTGFFGTNSSGKTSILQFLLMLKQTVESADRNTVLAFNGPYTELGTFRDVVNEHRVPSIIRFCVSWNKYNSSFVADPMVTAFDAAIEGTVRSLSVKEFNYGLKGGFTGYSLLGGLRQKEEASTKGHTYQLVEEPLSVKEGKLDFHGEIKVTDLKHGVIPIKSYGFPIESYSQVDDEDLIGAAYLFEEAFSGIYYLGPLREYPHRIYIWGGEEPQNVGVRGENFAAALLSSQARKTGVARRVAQCLKELGLVDSFKVQPIAKGRQEYEVLVKRTADSTEVPITDVGFGVSQILPVLTLCYYVPEGSTIILEQPEIHLHPAVQAGLADVLIDAIKSRNVQIILESHSDHLLRRLQRRIAEEQFSNEDAALYFCKNETGASELEELQVNEYGYITNWPRNFFGDQTAMEDYSAQSEETIRRKKVERGQEAERRQEVTA